MIIRQQYSRFTFSIILLIIQFFSVQSIFLRKHSLHEDHWDYKNATAGAWGQKYCNQSSNQSPANIIDKSLLSSCHKNYKLELKQKNQNITTQIVNTGKALYVSGNWDKLKVTLDNKLLEYNAQNFEFHSPSEHTINGQYHDLELQIQHFISPDYVVTGQKNHAVLSIFFDIGNEPNPFFYQNEQQKGYLNPNHSCEKGKCKKKDDFKLNFDNFKPKIEQVYYYQGSFTTPPCIPDVNWFIVSDVQTISENQLLMFKNYWSLNSKFADNYRNPNPNQWKGNNRPIQQTITPMKFKVNNTKC